ncbi:hypothetical protein H311_01154, partial [Anncaliia algerae PRA109]
MCILVVTIVHIPSHLCVYLQSLVCIFAVTCVQLCCHLCTTLWSHMFTFVVTLSYINKINFVNVLKIFKLLKNPIIYMTAINPRKLRKNITKEMIEKLKKLLKENRSTEYMSQILDISKRTSQRLIKRFNSGEFDSLENFRSEMEKKRGVRKKHIEVKNFIELCIQENCTITQEAIRQKLAEENINISRSVISRLLKNL